MYGKVVKKSEYEIKFGSKEQMVNVFICCKSLKNNINYVVFSYASEKETSKLYYGMVHINGSKLVSMEPKPGSEEIIKDLVWKITNKQELKDYEIIDINKADRIEVISFNTLELKPEVINSLVDLTIPKDKSQEDNSNNKSSSTGCIIFIVVLLILGIGGMTLYDVVMKKIGLGQELICEKKTSDTKINAFINKKIDILYNRIDDFDKITENTSYVFNNADNYNNFKEKGIYYKYLSKSTLDENGIKWDDEHYIFVNIAAMTENIEYVVDDTNITLKGSINEDKAILENQQYTCNMQKREE